MKIKDISRIIFIGAFYSMGLMSCDISELPYSSVTDEELASNPESVKAVTLGTYSQLKLPRYYTAIHYIGEYGGDNISFSGSTTSHTFYLYNYQRIATNSIVTDFWTAAYKMIINCNNVIAISKEGTTAEMDHLIGENYFLRAMLYHQLTYTFGKSYHIASDNDLAVPLKLSTDINDYPPRATVKSLYEQVVKDLEKAETLMGESDVEESVCYANVWAAKALLSRVYLYMHQYEKAAAYATDVIEHSGKKLLSSQQYLTMNELTPEGNPEAIFATRLIKGLDDENCDYSSLYTTIQGEGWGEVYASLPLRQAFSKYPSDVRATFIKPQYVAPDKNGVQPYEISFVGENYFYNNGETPVRDPLHRQYFRSQPVKPITRGYGIITDDKNDTFEFADNQVQTRDDGTSYVKARQLSRDKSGTIVGQAEWVEYEVQVQKKMEKRNDYPKYFINKCALQEQQPLLHSPMFVRLSEMYLNRAEANYYLSDFAAAEVDINIIKERATIPLYSKQVDGELLDAILDERRKELYLESQRKFDLLRNDKVIDRHFPGAHDRGTESAVVLEVNVTDACAVNYLPQREIDAYPIPLEQNP